jgi:hypothetical protein
MLTEKTSIERYRERAAQLRAIAQEMPNGEDRDLLIKVANDYEELADPANILGRANRPFSEP